MEVARALTWGGVVGKSWRGLTSAATEGVAADLRPFAPIILRLRGRCSAAAALSLRTEQERWKAPGPDHGSAVLDPEAGPHRPPLPTAGKCALRLSGRAQKATRRSWPWQCGWGESERPACPPTRGAAEHGGWKSLNNTLCLQNKRAKKNTEIGKK